MYDLIANLFFSLQILIYLFIYLSFPVSTQKPSTPFQGLQRSPLITTFHQGGDKAVKLPV